MVNSFSVTLMQTRVKRFLVASDYLRKNNDSLYKIIKRLRVQGTYSKNIENKILMALLSPLIFGSIIGGICSFIIIRVLKINTLSVGSIFTSIQLAICVSPSNIILR